MPDNKKLVFSPGNVWPKDSEIAPFFGFPAWWRRFVFQILSPREITVYLYICSTMDPNWVSYPTIEQITDDLNVKSRLTIKAAIEELIRNGFLLQSQHPIRGRVMSKRHVFQRPSIEHTLITLLRENKIDARLFPMPSEHSLNERAVGDEAIASAMRRILGDFYEPYRHVVREDPQNARDLLIGMLQQRLDERVAKVAFEAARDFTNVPNWEAMLNALASLPPHIRDLYKPPKEAQEQIDKLDEEVPF